MQLQVCVRQPRGQIGDGGLAVVVEVGAGGEELEGLEAVPRNLSQMIAGETKLVEQMRRHPESALSHGSPPRPQESPGRSVHLTRGANGGFGDNGSTRRNGATET